MRVAEYTVWLNADTFESSGAKLEDLPGFIEYNYQGEEELD